MTAPQPILDEDITRVTPGVSATIVGDRVVVVHPADNTVHVLNETAALIWQALSPASMVRDLIDDLASHVGLNPEAIADDVRTTLARFVHADIATVGPPSFVLGPPDFTAEHHIAHRYRADRQRVHTRGRLGDVKYRSRSAHPLLTSFLEQVDWTSTIGPVRAGSAPVVFHTNNAEIAAAVRAAFAALPEVPPEELVTRSTSVDNIGNGDGSDEPNTTATSQRPPAFTDTQFRPGVFRATDPRAITREPSRPRTPDPRVPYDPRADEEAGLVDETRAPTEISVLDTGKDGPRRYRAFIDGRRVWSGGSVDKTVRFIITETNQICVNRTADHILFHAGAVERDGKVILIAGDSGHGKSTLTAALTMSGFNYLTDEIASVEPETLNVIPYPKAIDLDRTARELVRLNGANCAIEQTSEGWAGQSHDKAPVAVSTLGRASLGGVLTLLVLLGNPSASALDTAPVVEPGGGPDPRDKATPTNVLWHVDDDIKTLVDLLGTVFRPSFVNPQALPALATLGDRVAIVRLDRLPLTRAVAEVTSAFERVIQTATPLL